MAATSPDIPPPTAVSASMTRRCRGAYDRKVYGREYHELKPPLLEGIKVLYRWVVGSHDDSGTFHKIDYGPRVKIIGTPPF
jgi:hypothetical protein